MTTPSRQQLLKKSLLFVAPFQIAAIAAAIIGAFLGAKGMTVGLTSVIVITLWAPAALSWIARVQVPVALQVNYFVFIILSSLAGSGLGMYGRIPEWDKWVHTYSGVFLAWLGFFAVQQAEVTTKGTAPKWLSIVMGIATALAFAALWEIGEFWSDHTLGTHTQPNLEDTIIDMVAAGVGAAIATLFAVFARFPASVLSRAFTRK
jgi:hypothetical protein